MLTAYGLPLLVLPLPICIPIVLIAGNHCKPCILTTDSVEADFELRADDYSTWEERRKALETLLIE